MTEHSTATHESEVKSLSRVYMNTHTHTHVCAAVHGVTKNRTWLSSWTTTKHIYIYTHTHTFFLYSFPLWLIIESWIYLMCYTVGASVFHSMCKSLHLLIPISRAIPLPAASPLASTSLYSVWDPFGSYWLMLLFLPSKVTAMKRKWNRELSYLYKSMKKNEKLGKRELFLK